MATGRAIRGGSVHLATTQRSGEPKAPPARVPRPPFPGAPRAVCALPAASRAASQARASEGAKARDPPALRRADRREPHSAALTEAALSRWISAVDRRSSAPEGPPPPLRRDRVRIPTQAHGLEGHRRNRVHAGRWRWHRGRNPIRAPRACDGDDSKCCLPSPGCWKRCTAGTRAQVRPPPHSPMTRRGRLAAATVFAARAGTAPNTAAYTSENSST